MSIRFIGGIRSTPFRGVRHEDIMAEREKAWLARIDDQSNSRFGDVIARRFNPRYEQRPSLLWEYGHRRAGWWIKPRLDGVIFRPYLDAKKDLSQEDGGHYDYDMTRGTVILLWGSRYGVPAARHCLYVTFDRHYTEAMREYLSS